MKSFFFTLCLLSAALQLTAAPAADEARLLRFPAVGGGKIVFCYAGDLYSVDINGGAAVKLTSDVGYECFPKVSPDGKTVAFTAQYDGNTEVYTIPITGGEPCLRIKILHRSFCSALRRRTVFDRLLRLLGSLGGLGLRRVHRSFAAAGAGRYDSGQRDAAQFFQ